jgi:TonB-dependent starch-binding outer membrane protein SusC
VVKNDSFFYLLTYNPNPMPNKVRVGLLGLILCFSLASTKAQMLATASKPVTKQGSERSVHVISLKNALATLEEKYHVSFLFKSDLVATRMVVTHQEQVVKGGIEEELKSLLTANGLKYEKIRDDFFVVQASIDQGELSVPALVAKGGIPASKGIEALAAHAATLTPLHNVVRKQDLAVRGRVTSAAGEALPGVAVVVKGTTTGVSTDVSGNYAITVPDENSVLVFSYIGFTTQEINVAGRSVVNVQMAPDTKALSEVQVVGYGTMERREVTGAIASVRAEELMRVPAVSVDAALQGQASGVQVSQATGVPGGPVRVMVRGTNSISAGTEPLWIIDGMPIYNEFSGLSRNATTIPQNPLASINPNDIESIEVLKDAAATAIYGSRGSNGVIIVTTKTGKRGKGVTNIDFQRGVTDLTRTPEDIGFASGPQWLSLVEQARINSGQAGPFNVNQNLNQGRDPNATLTPDQLADTNWFDQILRQGSFQDFNVSTSRGFDGGNFFLSGNYRDDEGVQIGNRFQRVSARLNVDFQPIKNLTAGARLNVAYTRNQRAPMGGAPSGNSFYAAGGFSHAATNALPIYPVFKNEQLFDPLSGNNLLASRPDQGNIRNEVEQYRGLGGLFLEYALPWVPGLSVRTEGSFDIFQSSNIEWANTIVRERSAYAFDHSATFQNLNYNLYGTYNRAFGQNHNLNLVAGTESQQQNQRTRNLEGDNLNGAYPELGSPNRVLRMSAGMGGERYLRAFFGRANYRLMDKYLLGVSLRRDGASVFSPELRWGTFAAVSGGWIISEENFMQGLPAVNLLKIRGSFGQTGNQNIPPNITETQFAGWGRYGTRDLGVGAGDLLTNIGAQGITWETTDSYDAGIDFEMFNNRVTGSVGYFVQDAKDLLLATPIPESAGMFTGHNIWTNIGDMRNQGLEFNISTVNIDRGGFRWSTSFNITTNRNKIMRLTPVLDQNPLGIPSGATVTRTGGRLGAYFIADYAGIHPTEGYEQIHEIDRDLFLRTGQTVRTGNLIPASNANLINHRFVHEDKTGLPTYFGGFSNTFSLAGFDLNVLFTFQGGNYIYDDAERINRYVGIGTTVLRSDLVGNTWTSENRDAQYPILMWNHRLNISRADGTTYTERFDGGGTARGLSRYLYKGDFIRLRNLQLGYTVPADLTNRVHLQGLRVFVAANNIWTITRYPGWDPELTLLSDNPQARNLTQGFAGNQIPQVKSYSAGISLSF